MNEIISFLKNISPNSPEKIQAWASIFVLIVTIIMARYAKIALSTWKEEKKYNIIEDGLAHAYNALYLTFEFIRIRGDINKLDNAKQEELKSSKTGIPELDQIYCTIITREEFFNKIEKVEIFNTYKIATKVVQALNNDPKSPLYIFYKEFIKHYTGTRLDLDRLLRYKHSKIVLENNFKNGTLYYQGNNPKDPAYSILLKNYTDENIHKIGNNMCDLLDNLNENIQISEWVSKKKANV